MINTEILATITNDEYKDTAYADKVKADKTEEGLETEWVSKPRAITKNEMDIPGEERTEWHLVVTNIDKTRIFPTFEERTDASHL